MSNATRGFIVAIAFALAGCTSTAERAAYDDGKCKSYGATRGSAAYTNCRAQLDAAHTQAQAIRNAPVAIEPYRAPFDTSPNDPSRWRRAP